MKKQIIKKINDINQDIARKGLSIVLSNGQQMDDAWLPDEIKQMLIDECNRSEEKKTHLALIKYFGGPGTWWISEYLRDRSIFWKS